MSSDDENDFIMCENCEDQRGLCDTNFLVDDRRFNIKLDETFVVDTVSHKEKHFFVIKHDLYMLHLLQLIILNFHYSSSVSPAMQEFLSWIR